MLQYPCHHSIQFKVTSQVSFYLSINIINLVTFPKLIEVPLLLTEFSRKYCCKEVNNKIIEMYDTQKVSLPYLEGRFVQSKWSTDIQQTWKSNGEEEKSCEVYDWFYSDYNKTNSSRKYEICCRSYFNKGTEGKSDTPTNFSFSS